MLSYFPSALSVKTSMPDYARNELHGKSRPQTYSHSMYQDGGNAGLSESGLDTSQDSLGSFEVVSIGLQIPNVSRQSSVRRGGLK